MGFRVTWQIIQYLTLLQIHPNHQTCSKTVYVRGVSEKYPTCVYIIFFDYKGVVH